MGSVGVNVCVLVLFSLINIISGANYYYTQSNGTNQAWYSRLNTLSPGDTVTFGAGTYTMTGRIGLAFTGTPSALITIQGEVGQQVIFYRGDANQNGWDISGSSYFVVQNLEFVGSSKGLRFTSCSNGIVQFNKVHDTSDTAISCNDASSTYNKMVFRYNEVYNTGSGTSECFYLGCNYNDCVFMNGLAEYNYCHDTMSALTGWGSGIQLKTGSYNNTIRNNVFRNTKGPGVLIYDDYDLGINTVTGNYMITTGDNGIQATSGALIYNNVVIDAAANGIRVQANQIMSGAQIRNIFIGYNTVVSRLADSSYTIKIDSTSATNIVVANNAAWNTGGSSAYGIQATAATMFNNGYNGGSAVGTGAVLLQAVTTELNNPTTENWYPKTGSTLIGAASSMTLPASVNVDFNCLSRTSPSTLGAYQYSSVSNPNSWSPTQGTKVDYCSVSAVATTSRPPAATTGFQSTTSRIMTTSQPVPATTSRPPAATTGFQSTTSRVMTTSQPVPATTGFQLTTSRVMTTSQPVPATTSQPVPATTGFQSTTSRVMTSSQQPDATTQSQPVATTYSQSGGTTASEPVPATTDQDDIATTASLGSLTTSRLTPATTNRAPQATTSRATPITTRPVTSQAPRFATTHVLSTTGTNYGSCNTTANCPTNSKCVSKYCRCNQGYQVQGTQCIEAHSPSELASSSTQLKLALLSLLLSLCILVIH